MLTQNNVNILVEFEQKLLFEKTSESDESFINRNASDCYNGTKCYVDLTESIGPSKYLAFVLYSTWRKFSSLCANKKRFLR